MPTYILFGTTLSEFPRTKNNQYECLMENAAGVITDDEVCFLVKNAESLGVATDLVWARVIEDLGRNYSIEEIYEYGGNSSVSRTGVGLYRALIVPDLHRFAEATDLEIMNDLQGYFWRIFYNRGDTQEILKTNLTTPMREIYGQAWSYYNSAGRNKGALFPAISTSYQIAGEHYMEVKACFDEKKPFQDDRLSKDIRRLCLSCFYARNLMTNYRSLHNALENALKALDDAQEVNSSNYKSRDALIASITHSKVNYEMYSLLSDTYSTTIREDLFSLNPNLMTAAYSQIFMVVGANLRHKRAEIDIFRYALLGLIKSKISKEVLVNIFEQTELFNGIRKLGRASQKRRTPQLSGEDHG